MRALVATCQVLFFGTRAPSAHEPDANLVIWFRQVMMGDGQVSQGDMVVKPNATKVRKLGDGRVLAGYAGSTADALTLMERLEGKLEEHEGAA